MTTLLLAAAGGVTIGSGLVVAVVAVITLLLAAATVFGQWRVSRNTAIVASYRDAAQAWEAKSTALTDEVGELRAEVASKDALIADLTSQITELRGHLNAIQDMMIGASALETLRTEIIGARDKIIAVVKGAS